MLASPATPMYRTHDDVCSFNHPAALSWLRRTLPNGTITSIAQAWKASEGSCAGSTVHGSSSTYVVINVIHLTGGADAQRVDSTTGTFTALTIFVQVSRRMEAADFDGATRLYGARKILLVSIVEHDFDRYGPGLGLSLITASPSPSSKPPTCRMQFSFSSCFPNKARPETLETSNYWACQHSSVATRLRRLKSASLTPQPT